MKIITKIKYLITLVSFMGSAFALGPVTLEKESGGKLDGTAWSSDSLKDKVHVLFYVDPDEKELNEHVGERLKKENFNRKNYASVAVINMDATWLPNFALENALKKKQEKYPDTLYVKDLKKVLVSKWELKDDSSNVLLFDKSGKLIFKIEGKASNDQLESLVKMIKENL